MKRILFFLVILIVASFASLVTTQTKYSLKVGSFINIPSITEDVQIQTKPTSLTFVGDVMLARRVEWYLDTYGSSYVYLGLPELSTSTVLIGNFEAAIPKNHVQTPDFTMSFSVDSVHIPALKNYGFRYLSLANNHSFDKGTSGFLNTKKVLEINQMNSFGNPKDLSTSSIAYIELEDVVIALIGLSTLEKQPDEDELTLIFNEATKSSDLQISYLHWGVEYEAIHSKMQETLARKLVDLGSDAVIGNHPHVVQDIELYKGVPIFYSLGNFIFDQYFSKEVQEGLWIELSVVDGAFSYSLQGITSIGSRSVPRFMSAYENDLLLNDVAEKSSIEIQSMIRDGYIDVSNTEQ